MRRADADVGLPPSPPVPALAQTAFMWSSPFLLLERLRTRYGNRFTVHALARPPLVFLADLEEARAMFRAGPEVLCPGKGGAVIEPIVGPHSFLTADGERHARTRIPLARYLAERAVQLEAATVRQIVEEEIASWPRGSPIALHDRLRALTLRVILHTLFGSDLALVPELHARVLSMLSVTSGTSLTLPATRAVPPNRLAWKRFLRDRREVDAMLASVIAARRASTARTDDVLDALLANDRDGASTYVRDNLVSLILAGHETTAAQLAWAFQLLAHHPRICAELVADIDAGRSEYLSATVQETLRHRPVFLFAIPRAVCAPFVLGGMTYHPGVELLACSYLVQHDPEAFPKPQEFRPARFLDAPPGPNWIPWGGGRRRCPGRSLALFELETVLRVVLSSVRIRPASATPERPRWRTVIVAPHAGSRVVLTDRGEQRRAVAA